MKRKIILFALVAILSLSSVMAAILLLGKQSDINSITTVAGDNAREDADYDIAADNSGDDADEGTGDSSGETAGEDAEGDGDTDEAEDSVQYRTVSFVTNGGDTVSPVRVKKGRTLSSVPTTQKYGALFDGWYTDPSLSQRFFQSTPIVSNITLYAKYDELVKNQALYNEKYVLTDQQPGLEFIVNSQSALTQAQVLELLTLEIADGSKYITLEATGSNPYTIRAAGGFTPGASYTLTLGDGLSFDGKDDSVRMCTFTIEKEEVLNLRISGDVYNIAASEISNIIVNGEAVDELTSGIFGDSAAAAGTFEYSGGGLSAGMIVCVYSGVHPNERKIEVDYTGDEVAYIRITSTDGMMIHFESINEQDAQDVLFMPDTIPIDRGDFSEDEFEDLEFTFVFDWTEYSLFADLGIDARTTLEKGDFIILYDSEDTGFAEYLEIVSAETDGDQITVTFKYTTLKAIQQAMDYYTSVAKSGEELLRDIDLQSLEAKIEKQVLDNGFAQNALQYLAVASMQTDGFQKISGLEDLTVKDENGVMLTQDEMQLLFNGTFEYEGDNGITVKATISDSLEKIEGFNDGVHVALQIFGEYSVDVGDGGQMTISIEATFVQEVCVLFGVSGEAEWGYWRGFLGIPIPYIKDYRMSASIGVLDYTGISFQVHITSHEVNDGTNIADITDELKNMLSIEDPEELDAGVEDLFEKYGEMLETETDYIDIFDKSIVDQKGWADPFFIIAYNFQLNFKIKADVNIMLGANMEYRSGTMYIFWFKLMAQTAGSRTIDMMDEEFSFQFYVMGKLGLRVGLEFKFAVGLFSTDLASIGLSAEAGPYLELYGYFIYEYHKIRTAGTPDWISEEQMIGALYIEFGIYFESYFNAEALGGEYYYNYELYSDMWELLTAGEAKNVYDFAYEIEEEETYVIKGSSTACLPKSYRNMAVLDLKTGDLLQDIYPLTKYNYSLSSEYFSFNKGTGEITVNVPSGVQYLECDLTLTWKVDKLAFSKYDLTSTIHLVWTNLTAGEMEERYEVRVVVGNAQRGYTTVWSDRVVKNELFTLPAENEIKALIGYDKDTVLINGEQKNLKYTDCLGYSAGISMQQKIDADTTFYFQVVDRTYELIIDGIENADGSKRSESFEARDNSNFDLSSLLQTGTSNTSLEIPYTKYLRVNCNITGDREAADTIDRIFAIQLLEGRDGSNGEYTAEYVDNTCIVTYSFVSDCGFEIEEQTQKVEKGGWPQDDTVLYLAGQSPPHKVVEWDERIGRATADTTFTAFCTVADGTLYKITYEENEGSAVPDYQQFAGAPVTEPMPPTKTGYTFDGWFKDIALQDEFDFAEDKMPEYDLKLYAKWTAQTFTVSFITETPDAHGNTVSGFNVPQDISVTYNSEYGTLPTPAWSGTDKEKTHWFDGWYTSASGGEEITSSSIVSVAGGISLYAHYIILETIPDANVNFATQVHTYTFSGSGTAGVARVYVNYSFNDPVNYPDDGYTVWYNKSGTEEFTSQAPDDAGEYYIELRRSSDDAFKAHIIRSVAPVLVINPAVRTFVALPFGYAYPTYYLIDTNMTYLRPFEDGHIEFAYTLDPNASPEDLTNWTAATTITGLTPGTNYYFWSRAVGGENYLDAYGSNCVHVYTPLTPPPGG